MNADQVIKVLNRLHDIYNDKIGMVSKTEACEALEAAIKAVELTEPHEYWNIIYEAGWPKYYVCPKCNFITDVELDRCPSCQIKMRKGV